MKTLSEILSDETPEQDAPRDEQGRFAAEPEAAAPEPVTGVEVPAAAPEPESVPPTQMPEAEPDRVPFAALKDERKKRQDLEAELTRLRAMQAQPQAPAPTQAAMPADAPDMFEDPEGYTAWVRQTAAADAFEKAKEAFTLERVRQSAAAASVKYEDYGDALATFQGLVAENPALERVMMQQPDPAEWAYQTAKKHLEVSQYGSLEATINARVQAELAKLAATPLAPQLPKATLADAQSARTVTAPPVRAKTLAEILAR